LRFAWATGDITAGENSMTKKNQKVNMDDRAERFSLIRMERTFAKQ
jgi:hypothetical protein